MENKKSKKKISVFFIVIIFLVGLIIFLYPIVSGILSDRNQTCVINDYVSQASKYTASQLEEQQEVAKEHNEQIATGLEGMSHVDLLKTGEIIGCIKIPKIDVNLPIYNDVTEESLRKGAGHIANSSYPTSELSTHSIFTGHRGLTTATLFTDLDKLENEDEFFVIMFGKQFTYKVDQIKIVAPEETDDLEIVPNKNYVTLVTCTPYMINTHRILVRGEFVKEEPAPYEELVEEVEEVFSMESETSNGIGGFVIMFGLILFILIILIIIKRKKKEQKEK